METVTDFIILGSEITADGDCSHEIKRHLVLWRKADKPRQHIIKQRCYFAAKGRYSQSYDFSSSRVWMWELDYKENSTKELMLLNCGVEDSWKSKGVCKIKPINPKGNQVLNIHWKDGYWSWSSNTLATWCVFISKDHDAGKDRRQEEKGLKENEMVGWHHRLDGRVWAGSRSWWWTGKSGMLQSMRSQTVGYNWATELKKKRLPTWLRQERICLKCRRSEFNPLVGKIPRRRAW